MIPPFPLYISDDNSAIPVLAAIQTTTTAGTQNEHRDTSLIIAGDFNRHHPMWGGSHILSKLIEYASDLVEFFQTQDLHSCLRRGTATYWVLNNQDHNGQTGSAAQMHYYVNTF